MARSGRKRSKRKYKQLTILLFLVLFLGGGYYYLKIYTSDSSAPAVPTSSVPQYTLLENTDSIQNLAVVIYNSNISINIISETFYKSQIYWPYIYIANKQVITNPLNIEGDLVLKIPRLSDKLLNLQDTVSTNKAKHLADSILNNVTQPI